MVARRPGPVVAGIPPVPVGDLLLAVVVVEEKDVVGPKQFPLRAVWAEVALEEIVALHLENLDRVVRRLRVHDHSGELVLRSLVPHQVEHLTRDLVEENVRGAPVLRSVVETQLSHAAEAVVFGHFPLPALSEFLAVAGVPRAGRGPNLAVVIHLRLIHHQGHILVAVGQMGELVIVDRVRIAARRPCPCVVGGVDVAVGRHIDGGDVVVDDIHRRPLRTARW